MITMNMIMVMVMMVVVMVVVMVMVMEMGMVMVMVMVRFPTDFSAPVRLSCLDPMSPSLISVVLTLIDLVGEGICKYL